MTQLSIYCNFSKKVFIITFFCHLHWAFLSKYTSLLPLADLNAMDSMKTPVPQSSPQPSQFAFFRPSHSVFNTHMNRVLQWRSDCQLVLSLVVPFIQVKLSKSLSAINVSLEEPVSFFKDAVYNTILLPKIFVCKIYIVPIFSIFLWAYCMTDLLKLFKNSLFWAYQCDFRFGKSRLWQILVKIVHSCE